MDKVWLGRFQRMSLMLTEEKCGKLAGAHVLVLGIGGVGGAAVEMLARAGIGQLTLVDGDTVDETNSNRQLSALSSTIGKAKTDIWAERCREINPGIKLNLISRFLRSPDEITELLNGEFDFAVDAIDELLPKVTFLAGVKEKNIPCVSAMGAGGKMDPAAVETADISKTHSCPLAKVVRKELRMRGVNKGIRCVFSSEVPAVRFGERKIGSISYMPVIFGCFCAYEVISSLIGDKNT